MQKVIPGQQSMACASQNDSAIPERVPPRVVMAFRFVELCNFRMGVQSFPGNDGMEIRDMELHPKQEAVFRTALECLGKYFCEE